MGTNILNIKCLSITMAICVKQDLSNIQSSIYKKIKQTCGWVEKSYEKNVLIKSSIIVEEDILKNSISSSTIIDNFFSQSNPFHPIPDE